MVVVVVVVAVVAVVVVVEINQVQSSTIKYNQVQSSTIKHAPMCAYHPSPPSKPCTLHSLFVYLPTSLVAATSECEIFRLGVWSQGTAYKQ